MSPTLDAPASPAQLLDPRDGPVDPAEATLSARRLRYTTDVPRALNEADIPEPVHELCAQLGKKGFRAWIVGGCVRDLLRGMPVSDWDLATDASPEQVQSTFRRTVPTGIAHGTVTVVHRGEHYEVTTLRGEGAYSDGRRPDSVHFVSDIEDDLARRDFTVNAIAYDPRARQIVDPWGGCRDLDARILRAVRDPSERFAEDGLRALRAARFVATLELELDPATEGAIAGALDTLRKVSPERVREEWVKALTKARAPSRAFEVMRRTGMLAVHAPPLATLDDEAFAHAMRRLDAAPPRVPIRLAALLFDRADAIDALLRALRFSNEEREVTLHLVRTLDRDLIEDAAASGASLRRILARIGRSQLSAALDLARAERIASGRDLAPLEALEARARAELDSGAPLTTGELAVRGDDVMNALGTGPSRAIGLVLSRLLERALEDPSLNRRERLLALIPECAGASSREDRT